MIPLSFLKDGFAGHRILCGQFSLPAFWMCHMLLLVFLCEITFLWGWLSKRLMSWWLDYNDSEYVLSPFLLCALLMFLDEQGCVCHQIPGHVGFFLLKYYPLHAYCIPQPLGCSFPLFSLLFLSLLPKLDNYQLTMFHYNG